MYLKKVKDIYLSMSNKAEKNKQWIEAKKKFRLSNMHIQMARELGMNPKKFGGLANHKQEPWKAPLPVFIEDLYLKRFKKEKPDIVKPLKRMFTPVKIHKYRMHGMLVLFYR
ncbi:MAG: hypothetical protein NG747_15595 [Candidatus Brocadia sp.]|nr:hypothetical protein [Candidatus Brocadia sp.]